LKPLATIWSDFCLLLFFTFLLISVFTFGSFAQATDSAEQKNGTFHSGINAENQSFSITKIYPNPVKDFVNIEIQLSESGALQLTLINMLGTEVKKWEPNVLAKGDQKLKIDLSFLKTGIYFLKISNSGKVLTQVLKKN
jgi:hypothetical protein